MSIHVFVDIRRPLMFREGCMSADVGQSCEVPNPVCLMMRAPYEAAARVKQRNVAALAGFARCTFHLYPVE